MIRVLTHLGICLGEVLVVHTRSLAEEFSPWTVGCIAATAGATAWSLFQHWSASRDSSASQWQQFGLQARPLPVVDEC